MADGDLHEQIEALEQQIERLADAAERCRKFIFAAKIAIAVGALGMLALLMGLVRGPQPLIVATTALVGGIVALGTNTATLRQFVESLAAAEQMRAQLIGGMALRVVAKSDA